MTAALLTLWLAAQAAAPTVQAQPQTKLAVPTSQPAATGQAPASKSLAPPAVTYEDGKVTIMAADCGLNEVLRAVSHQTNVPIEGRLDGDERVAVKIGPDSLRDVLLTLLQGSHYSFVLISRESQPQRIEKIVLMSRLSPPMPGAGTTQPEHAPTIDEVPIGTVISPDETDPDAPPPPPRQPSVTGPDGKPIAVPKIINSQPITPAPKNMQPAPGATTPGPPK